MSHTEPTPRRSWPWIVAVLVAVVAVVVGVSLISSALATPSAQQDDQPDAAAIPPTSSSPTPATKTPRPSASTPTPKATALSSADIAAIEKAVEDGEPKALYDFLADPVHVEFAASDFDADRSPDNAINDLAYITGTTGWTWNVDDATLAALRSGAYAENFPESAIVGESAEGYVLSFTVRKTDVTSIFVSKSIGLATTTAP